MNTQPHSIPAATRAADAGGIAAHGLSVRQRLLVMAISYIPFVHLAGLIAFAIAFPAGLPVRIMAAAALLYLPPAILARLIAKGFPIRSTVLAIGSRDFFKWWTLINLQMLFNRLPELEEAMRIVPGLYSAWLRLWGSKIGRLVFWAPGTRILDRSFIDVGDDVLFGAGVLLAPHLMVRNPDQTNEVLLAPVRIGARVVVGGHSMLGPGSEIAPGEATIGRLLLRPFAKWEKGRRVSR